MNVPLESELQKHVGRVLDPDRPARDAVNIAMIRNFCDAIGDNNPVYLDEAAAHKAGFASIVAPPGMLRTWTMVPPTEQMAPAAQLAQSVYTVLEDAGFTSKAATNCNQRFVRYLVPGDHLHSATHLVAVSPQKRTALGDGYFIDSETSFYDGFDELVAVMGWRSLRYRPRDLSRPAEGSAAAPTPAVTTPVANTPQPWQVPITPTLIISGAMASRDYQDVHHDRALARLRGMPDIFTNMMTTSGLIGRYVTDWAGPRVRLLSINLTLGVPNHPGDTLILSTEASSDDPVTGARTLVISGINSLGRHVKAEVSMDIAS